MTEVYSIPEEWMGLNVTVSEEIVEELYRMVLVEANTLAYPTFVTRLHQEVISVYREKMLPHWSKSPHEFRLEELPGVFKWVKNNLGHLLGMVLKKEIRLDFNYAGDWLNFTALLRRIKKERIAEIFTEAYMSDKVFGEKFTFLSELGHEDS